VSAITGTMMSSISQVERMSRSRCWSATYPDGFRTTELQPAITQKSGKIAAFRICLTLSTSSLRQWCPGVQGRYGTGPPLATTLDNLPNGRLSAAAVKLIGIDPYPLTGEAET